MEKRTSLHEDASKLIPELSQWNDGNGIDLNDWLNTIARYDHAIGYAAFFWPDFVLHDDCIFIDAPSVENYENWMSKFQGNKANVEGMLNHRHILDFFCHSDVEPTREIVVHMCQILKDMWSCKLQRDFPDRHFTVKCVGDESTDLLDYQITVYQQRT
jgi:hypothetical protein